MKNKKIYIETWGCQMNISDSERVLQLLSELNYQNSNDIEKADLIFLNTCYIREKAKHKLISRLGVLKKYKKNNPDTKIIVAGCVSEAEKQNLIKSAPHIDLVIGTGKIEKIKDLVKMIYQNKKTLIETGFEDSYDIKIHSAPPLLTNQSNISRYLNIMKGCNNFCTFCVVPYTRGKEISKKEKYILNEADLLIKSGVKEIILLGQNVNSYGLDIENEDVNFVNLIYNISKLKDLLRIRFTSSNPHNFNKNLAKAFKNIEKLGKYMHLPVQSGCDKILKAMNRKVDIKKYLEKIFWLKEFVNDIAVSTDIIVGFPGEDDDSFEKTLDLIKKVRFNFIYAFKYSPRKKTPAANFKNQIAEDIKTKRLAKLNNLQDKISAEIAGNYIDKTMHVLVQYSSKKESDAYYGRSEYFNLVKIKSQKNILGKYLPVNIIDGNKNILIGKC